MAPPAFATPLMAAPPLARASARTARQPPSPSPSSSSPPRAPRTRLIHTRLRLHLLHLQRQSRRAATPLHAAAEDAVPLPRAPRAPAVRLPGIATTSDTLTSPSPSSSSPRASSSASASLSRTITAASARAAAAAASTRSAASAASAAARSSASAASTEPRALRKRYFSPEERRARSERLRALWRDPEWRALMLAHRRSKSSVRQRSEHAKKLWQDEAYRQKMREARLGRPAPNKGISPSAATRLRMSLTRRGAVLSEETRRKMSLAKRNRAEDDDWPRLISESKKGKTKEYFAMRREFRALHRDLKLWSDSYRAKHGRLPSAKTYEIFVAPMMVFRIRRYLTLREAIGSDEPDAKSAIMSND